MFTSSQLTQSIHKRLASCTLAFALMASLMPTAAQAPIDLRVALVIGNGAYPGAAALANPGNDAKAMGDTLRGLGFTVVEARDASRAQMNDAITKVRDTLRGKNGIGMLYYAGHGLQLDWRNYMVPVDAKLSKASDVPEQTVELGAVIEAFKQAGNRMNIVVLDACRDNPFAGTVSAKGLAQLDAPPGTFLAFATAPGNVAEDGEAKADANGLYTRYLLQELKKPQAKIEDVFKRVRLNVRQQSQGRQIPWESTSLEDDFFFNAGLKPTQRLSESDKAKNFETEKAEWDKIKDSKNVNDFYTFLQKYPNGNINGLAQSRVELLQRSKTTAVADKTGLKQSAMIDAFIHGDKYLFELRDGYSNAVLGRASIQTVVRSEDLIEGISDNPSLVGGAELNRSGFIRRDGVGSYDPPYGLFPNGELKIGTQASTRTNVTHNNGFKQWVEIQSKVVGRETLDTAFGKINTIRVDVSFLYQNGNRSLRSLWYDPDWGYSVRMRLENRSARGGAADIIIRETLSRERGKA
jgi:Caspase domain